MFQKSVSRSLSVRLYTTSLRTFLFNGESKNQTRFTNSLRESRAHLRSLELVVFQIMLFGRRFRVLVSVSAAFPVSPTDGEVVYNYRASIDTANFLGQFFRTISQVLNLGSSNNGARKYLNFLVTSVCNTSLDKTEQVRTILKKI